MRFILFSFCLSYAFNLFSQNDKNLSEIFQTTIDQTKPDGEIFVLFLNYEIEAENDAELNNYLKSRFRIKKKKFKRTISVARQNRFEMNPTINTYKVLNKFSYRNEIDSLYKEFRQLNKDNSAVDDLVPPFWICFITNPVFITTDVYIISLVYMKSLHGGVTYTYVFERDKDKNTSLLKKFETSVS